MTNLIGILFSRLPLASQLLMIFGLMLFCSGCGREPGVPTPGVPILFHLSDQDSIANVPKSRAALIVSQLEMVAPDAAQRKITIKLLPADASAFEKLTTENLGKTIIVVQGSNVVATTKVVIAVSAQAGITFPVNTNLDFQSVYRQMLKLSKQ